MSRIKSFDTIKNAIVTDPFYPCCTINGTNPYDEKIMSMPSVITSHNNVALSLTSTYKIIKGNYFFFVFNFDNYYHFLYDTLPYLYFYFAASCSHMDLKLLIAANHKFLPFQIEMFKLLGLNEEHFVRAEDNKCYENIIIPTSLTHGHNSSNSSCSNEVPEEEAKYIWRLLARHIPKSPFSSSKKIYISRRSHLHNNTNNIGTNYTTRRRCINEDDVVNLFLQHGYTEIFSENLTTEEKFNLFANATHVAGFIGGGLANLLFSLSTTQVTCIETPEFLRINQRFVHSMNHTNITYLPITQHAPFNGPWPLYTRVKVKTTNQIGELVQWHDTYYSLQVAEKPVAGFSLNDTFITVIATPEELEPLDGGLNSPFICDIESLRRHLESISESDK